MMKVLGEFLQHQYDNRDKLNKDVRFMILNKEDLTVVATFNRDNIPIDLPDEYLSKGIFQINSNSAINCVTLIITDLPKENLMFVE